MPIEQRAAVPNVNKARACFPPASGGEAAAAFAAGHSVQVRKQDSQISTSRLLKTVIFQLHQSLGRAERRDNDRHARATPREKNFDEQSVANGRNRI
jgi:hypothetical protein